MFNDILKSVVDITFAKVQNLKYSKIPMKKLRSVAHNFLGSHALFINILSGPISACAGEHLAQHSVAIKVKAQVSENSSFLKSKQNTKK